MRHIKIILRILRSESLLDDIYSLIFGAFNGFKFLKSPKVYYKNEGTINIGGRFNFGF